jgi:lipopolysaccharide/colanic/teichoic acid biosynthesis glycosyltransferase
MSPERPCFHTEVLKLRTHMNTASQTSEAIDRKDGCGSARSRSAKPAHAVTTPAPVAPPGPRCYPLCKVVVEWTAALCLLTLTGPLILLLALLVKLTSRGPAFYRQTRLGWGGVQFTIYKLRTMVDRCESLTGPRWSLPGDPRITRLGSLLRRTHLDELPQLLNVLRGDMSLIGPRPERPEFLAELERACPRYRERLAVRPGVTGLAQVQLPSDTSVDSVRRKLAYDLYYIHHLSFKLDVVLLVCTAVYAVGLPFGFAARLLRVPHGEIVEGEMRSSKGDPKRIAA